MPTYTYKCLDEEHIFEARQKFSDDPLTECPECGSTVRRVINSVGIVFKGKGFYVTDNRGGSNAKNGSSKSSDAKGEKKADGEAKAESASKSEGSGSAETPKPAKEKPKAKEKS